MSLFARSYNRFAGSSSTSHSNSNPTPDPCPPNDQNITYRKKLSAVSTSLQGDDGLVAASPRNCYSRNTAVPSSLRRQQKVADEVDGVGMSTEKTPVELRAAEIRRMNSKKEEKRIETHHTPPPPIEAPVVNQKKSRTSTSSLASVFRSRASSPIERMRKFIGRSRSTSKQPKELAAQEVPTSSDKSTENEKMLIEELEKTRIQLSNAQCQLEKYREKEQIQKMNASVQSDTIPVLHVATMTSSEDSDKENVNPDVVCIEDDRIRLLEAEVAALRKECVEKTEDFRRTRKDFILILKEAVIRKDEAERKLDGITKTVADEDDWMTLMQQHRHTLRRNVLLMWVQKKLEPYSDELSVSNFSSDWTDCRAFCALLADLFPDLLTDSCSPIDGDCVSRCRRAFTALEIPFDERALGISASPTDSGAEDSSCSSIHGLTDWRFVMKTVFLIYKRGVLGK